MCSVENLLLLKRHCSLSLVCGKTVKEWGIKGDEVIFAMFYLSPQKWLPESFSCYSFDLTDISYGTNSQAQSGWYPLLFLFRKRFCGSHIAQFHHCIIQREPISLSKPSCPSPVISSACSKENCSLTHNQRKYEMLSAEDFHSYNMWRYS